jgi:carbamate kinase
LEILGLKAIVTLAAAGVMVICAGGGGVPVAARPGGGFIGVEAVIDKDRASALLAQALQADMLILLTDVDGVYLDFGTPSARRIVSAGTSILSPNSFAAGSMGPKVQAALRFTQASGGRTVIGRLEDARALVSGTAGTRIESGPAAIVTAPIRLRS